MIGFAHTRDAGNRVRKEVSTYLEGNWEKGLTKTKKAVE
jgi:hypothetical protein